MESEVLIVEDVMLLMLDDETGSVAGADTLHYTLGGAVLVELALRGRVDSDAGRAGKNGDKVVAVGSGALSDRLLQTAYEKVAKRPQDVQTLLREIGAGLQEPVVDRLVSRGLVRRENKRVLGLFRTTTFPAGDPRHEAALRREIRSVLEGRASPAPRTAAVIALLSSSGTLATLRPALPQSAEVLTRAKEIENGNWAASAVNTAVTKAAAEIAAATATIVLTTVLQPPA
ncbi:GOLPH3/VPS74 family protein [Streptomyces albidus (ex Kaewkla and Franco 2022)]|uniref:GOLPH3/VPS74 family protein n=1 Tax=Streptomyces albidus (ex Kaewkla and Franco 2022) TaxID=722709 RepID=UPI0015EF0507|nr:GPP34 family phosphoprotein [Streptomyces albidus (ex Kaewkla and Franco 2022)]